MALNSTDDDALAAGPSVGDLGARLDADVHHAVTQVRILEAEYAALLDDPEVIQEDRDATRLLLEHARAVLELAERALDRYRSGLHGICDRCAGPIGAERLEAIPDAVTCVTCQAGG